MDLMCPKCGEPWDNDTFHDAAEEQNTTYDAVARDFRKRGCEAIGWGKCSTPSTETDSVWGITRQDAASALYDMLGDDMDGAAAMLEDMGF